MTLSIRLWTLWLVLLSSLCLSTVSYGKDRIRYYINGADGSPLRVVDEKGNTVAAYRYSPFGESLAQKKPVRQVGPSRFVGGIEESNDLVYLKHRYYNPRIGRFYQPDPINFLAGGVGQTNRYQYGWNDPATYKDPNGQFLETLLDVSLATYSIKIAYDEPSWQNFLAASMDSAAVVIPFVPAVAGVSTRTAAKIAAKEGKVAKSGGNFVDGYRAVSKAEADDIAKNGFRPNPNGQSMQDKWFSETREGAEKFKQYYSDLDEVVKAKVPKDVYDRSYQHPNIDNTGPGFCVACEDLGRLKVDQ